MLARAVDDRAIDEMLGGPQEQRMGHYIGDAAALREKGAHPTGPEAGKIVPSRRAGLDLRQQVRLQFRGDRRRKEILHAHSATPFEPGDALVERAISGQSRQFTHASPPSLAVSDPPQPTTATARISTHSSGRPVASRRPRSMTDSDRESIRP